MRVQIEKFVKNDQKRTNSKTTVTTDPIRIFTYVFSF